MKITPIPNGARERDCLAVLLPKLFIHPCYLDAGKSARSCRANNVKTVLMIAMPVLRPFGRATRAGLERVLFSAGFLFFSITLSPVLAEIGFQADAWAPASSAAAWNLVSAEAYTLPGR